MVLRGKGQGTGPDNKIQKSLAIKYKHTVSTVGKGKRKGVSGRRLLQGGAVGIQPLPAVTPSPPFPLCLWVRVSVCLASKYLIRVRHVKLHFYTKINTTKEKILYKNLVSSPNLYTTKTGVTIYKTIGPFHLGLLSVNFVSLNTF